MQHQAPGPTDYELEHVWLLTVVTKAWAGQILAHISAAQDQPEIGRKNELSRLCLNWGQPKFGYHPNGRFASSQRPMFGLAAWGRHPNMPLIAWWRQVLQQLDKQHQKGLNSLVVLVIW